MRGSDDDGPRGVVLYARVASRAPEDAGWADEQMAALRGHADRKGYGVVGEASDVGRSGSNLERPGLDRVRDLVAAGGAWAVLTVSRDRFARGVAVRFLKDEFAGHGCELRHLEEGVRHARFLR